MDKSTLSIQDTYVKKLLSIKKIKIMNEIDGYKVRYEKKEKILYSRMDESMISSLKAISRKTGISVSEIIREGVRRLLHDIDNTGSLNLKIN